MSSKITIEHISVAGFRAFLERQEFPLLRNGQPQSLAIFAPNAKGKSSLVDAIEFYFSPQGTLERLGERRANTRAGREAIEHINARERGMASEVGIAFNENGSVFGDIRVVNLQGSGRPPAAEHVLSSRKLDFIIRGYQLRSFVESRTPEQRYEEVSEWFSLSSLVGIQRNLRALRRQVRQYLQEGRDRAERLRDLQRITNGGLHAWDEVLALEWINRTQLWPLDRELSLSALASTDPGYSTVQTRKAEEEDRLGLTALKQIGAALTAVYDVKDNEATPGGAAVAFEVAVASLRQAEEKEREEHAAAAKAAFGKLWEQAEVLLSSREVTLDACPVCDTNFAGTPKGTREGVVGYLRREMASLRTYRDAKQAFDGATRAVEQARDRLDGTLRVALQLTKDTSYAGRVPSFPAYVEAVQGWTPGQAVPDSTRIRSELGGLRSAVKSDQRRIEAAQGNQTYASALQKIDDLITLQGDLQLIERKRTELHALHSSLIEQATFIDGEIRQHVQAMLDRLRERMNAIFEAINKTKPPSIRLELPPEDDVNQQRLSLVIDFGQNRVGVLPAGYLSDSQIHTLALSLRLAALEVNNSRVPVLILDDIVTSYDSDHRKAIASLLATEFARWQVIAVTHDERFFGYLQDHMPQDRWLFRRITALEPEYGPRFHDHQISDELIERKLEHEEPAGNEIRQAEEEWLLKMCRGFGVDVRIRDLHQPYSYQRQELAEAFCRFLKDRRLTPPEVPGLANPFLRSLQRGDIENFGSHFQDNPNSVWSSGDEMARWEEFKYFRNLFRCSVCGRTKFHRPAASRLPLCAHRSCGVSFALWARTSLLSDAICGEQVIISYFRALCNGSKFGGVITAAALMRGISSQPVAHHGLRDVSVFEVADPGGSVIRPAAVKFRTGPGGRVRARSSPHAPLCRRLVPFRGASPLRRAAALLPNSIVSRYAELVIKCLALADRRRHIVGRADCRREV